jgi:hypothetical protein
LVSGESRDAATVSNTKQKIQFVWRLWIEYSKSIGLADQFLQELSTGQKYRVLGCFAHTVRDGRLSLLKCTYPLATSTMYSAVDGVGHTFKAYDLPDLRLDGQNNTLFLLLRQYRGYENEDPSETQHTRESYLAFMNMYDAKVFHSSIGDYMIPTAYS